MFLANQSNVTNVWKGIRQLVTLTPKEFFNPKRIVEDNQEITDTKAIGSVFNNYFATIGSRLAAQIPICGAYTHKVYLDTPSSSSFFLLPVTNFEIIERSWQEIFSQCSFLCLHYLCFRPEMLPCLQLHVFSWWLNNY